MGLAMDQAAKDIAGAAALPRRARRGDGTGIGAVGFCMGGGLALWSGTLSDESRSRSASTRPMPWERMDPAWSNYSGKDAMIHCAEEDGTSAGDGIQQAVEGASSRPAATVEVYDYPGTHHAFFNDDRPEVLRHRTQPAPPGRARFELLSRACGEPDRSRPGTGWPGDPADAVDAGGPDR